ncbi:MULTISPECIES: hypothetical protein [Bacillus cereus group]|uniref:hypothetical protein n=1 Tax=Bacillus cereus group TaxID=86661 RepID=UPI0021D338AC|nr:MULTISPECIES: hypothetical protein [Bacillus cereus group]MCU5201637.1 hypothetical protein [Bacillus paranthracis]MCU5374717.1 hypothetical protein [Bacillus pacificus]
MGELYKIKTAAEKLNELISKSSFSEEKKKRLYFSTDRLKRWAREEVIRSNFSSNSYYISENEFENILKLNVMIGLDGKTIEQATKELLVGSVLEKEEQMEEDRDKYEHVIQEALVRYSDGLKQPIENIGESLTEFETILLGHIQNMNEQIIHLSKEVSKLNGKVEDQNLLLENKTPLLLEGKTEEELSKSNEETKKEIAAAVSEQTETFVKEMEELKKTVQQQQLLLEKQENEKTTENKKRKGFFSRMFSGGN